MQEPFGARARLWGTVCEAFVDGSDGTRAANFLSWPVDRSDKKLRDGIHRIAHDAQTTSTRHVDKPRSPETNGMLADRAQLIAGAEPHELIFRSLVLQMSISFKATGALWSMSSSLRGAAASSRSSAARLASGSCR